MSQFTTDVDAQGATGESEQLSWTVIETVADAEGVDPLELPPLYSVVDPDALETLFQPRTELQDTTARVVFTYHGHEVTVTAGGTVEVT